MLCQLHNSVDKEEERKNEEEELMRKAGELPPDKVTITTPKRTSIALSYYVIEAIPRNRDMLYHVTSIRPLEDMVFQRIAYRIIYAIHNTYPDTYYTNIIPVRKLNSYSIEIFGIVNHPQRNAVCSAIYKALCKEFTAYDNPSVIKKVQTLSK